MAFNTLAGRGRLSLGFAIGIVLGLEDFLDFKNASSEGSVNSKVLING